MPRLRYRIAIWAGKLAILALRRLGRGGSALPGKVARAIEPRILQRLAAQCRRGVIVVTGTNGKTTTARMLAGMLRQAGRTVVHNRAGANLMSGLTSAFLEAADWAGRLDADLAVMEVDEATVPRAARELRPVGMVVTNFFRDQLDRYGELDRTVALVGEGLATLAPAGVALLCADDPLVARLGEGLRAQVLYFGLEIDAAAEEEAAGPAGAEAAAALEAPATAGAPVLAGRPRLATTAREARHCPRCGAPHRYDRRYYGHLGHYACTGCGRARPAPDVAVVEASAGGVEGTDIALRAGDERWTVRLPVPGRYNVYNALAASAAARAFGVPAACRVRALETYAAGFGRMEWFERRDRRLLLALVKNPAGFDEVIRTVVETAPGGARLVIAINDRLADGTDISWLWDVDFERLAAPGAVALAICSGIRAHDMAVRLKYAGFAVERLAVEPDLERAVVRGLEAVPRGGTLFVLPTYTALLELRAALSGRTGPLAAHDSASVRARASVGTPQDRAAPLPRTRRFWEV